MKRQFILSAFIALLPLAAMAQNVTSQARVKAIRKAYQTAQDMIARGKQEPQARNEFTINATYMISGAGQTNRKVEFYFLTDGYDGTDGYNETASLYLVRESFNIAARKFYHEYLFDVETGEPIFFYTKHDDYEEGIVEQRFYYQNRKVIHTIPDKLGEGFDQLKNFDRYKNLFNEYMSIQNGE